MVAVGQMARLVGHDVLHCGHGGLDQLPVDPKDAVLAAGAPQCWSSPASPREFASIKVCLVIDLVSAGQLVDELREKGNG